MTHSHGTHHRGRSGRDSHFYLYEEPICYCNGIPCLCPPDTGSLDASGSPKPNTLERRSPLPAGHYWFDAFGMNIPKADNWLKAFAGLGVHVDATEHFPSTDLASVRTWYLFTYAPTGGVPVVWDTSLGYPTVADSSIKSSGDTSSATLPLDPLDELSNWMNKVETELGGSLGAAAKFVPYVAVVGVGAAGFLLLKEFGILGKAKNVIRKRTSNNRPARRR